MTPLALETLRLERDGAVAALVFDSPPLNLFGPAMQRDLERALDEVEADPGVRVLRFESANPEYFVAHYDLEAILAETDGEPRTVPGGFNRLMARLRQLAAVTVATVAGAARGGGCELLLALDMRFASRQRAVFAFPEAALGILAAGGGTQRLPATIGRARALEMLLGCEDVAAEVAERYGLVNRALDDAELDAHVDGLCARIAAQPPRALALTKLAAGIATGEEGSGEALEALLLDLLKTKPEARRRMLDFIAAGGQTAAGERDFADLLELRGGEGQLG
jgi:enoyl-CoA hydratase/carnithine racemase